MSFFKGYPDYFENPVEMENCYTGWLAFPILIKENAPFSRKEFQIFLENHQIQTRVVFTGNILRQPMCSQIKKKVLEEGYPAADRVMKHGVLLPLHHGMTSGMFARFHDTVRKFVELY